MGPLRYEPRDQASPHQHIAHCGSARRDCSNDFCASSWAYAYIRRSPWSKYACAIGCRVAIRQEYVPSASAWRGTAVAGDDARVDTGADVGAGPGGTVRHAARGRRVAHRATAATNRIGTGAEERGESGTSESAYEAR